MNRLHGCYFICLFIFLLISETVSGINVIDKTCTQDSVQKSIHHLYDQTNKARKLLTDGETLQCLRLCKQVFEAYHGFPRAETYLGYLLSYKAQCQRQLGSLELSRSTHLLVDWFAITSDDQSLFNSNQTNKYLLESDCQNYLVAEEILRTQLRNVELTANSTRKSLILNNLAGNSLEMGSFCQAQKYFDSLNEMVLEGLLDEEFDRALFYRNYGYFYHLQGDLETARYYLEKSLELYGDSLPKGHFQIGFTYNYLAELYTDLSQNEKALSYFRESLTIFQSVLLKKHSSSLANTPVAYETVYLSSIASYIRFVNSLFDEDVEMLESIDLEQTFNLILSAENRINSFVQAQPPSSSVFIITDKVRGLFDAGIQFALHLYESTTENRFLNQTFEWSVRSKGYSIRVQVEKEQLALQNPETAALFVEQKRLMEKIRTNSRIDVGYLSSVLVDSLLMWTTKFENNSDSLLLPIVSIKHDIQVQSRFWNQSLISYQLFKESVIAFVLDKGKVTCHPIIFPLSFEDSVKKFKSVLYGERPRYYS
ncbi:MAG: tetratricopeptide repeat protein, partial [Bacteroidales bacterium]|nr:tetratricopeptide repeat protein [Bacteroidales bacterium]